MAMRRSLLLITAVAMTAITAPALAADLCRGAAPARGAPVHGPVLAVPDAASLCIATGASPSEWIRVPVSHLQTSRAALMAAAFGKNATCVIDAQGRGACVIEGHALAEAVQSPEIVKASYAWR
jgi:hypothetical protein